MTILEKLNEIAPKHVPNAVIGLNKKAYKAYGSVLSNICGDWSTKELSWNDMPCVLIQQTEDVLLMIKEQYDRYPAP